MHRYQDNHINDLSLSNDKKWISISENIYDTEPNQLWVFNIKSKKRYFIGNATTALSWAQNTNKVTYANKNKLYIAEFIE